MTAAIVKTDTAIPSERTVLVVDDEPDIRELLTITLERMRLNSVTAPDVSTARALLKERRFDLCLTDMQLPDGDGIDLVADIQHQQPNMPVAVITAHGSIDSAVRALKAGAFDFVAKPVRLDDLRNLISAAMRLDASNDNEGVQDTSTEDPADETRVRLLGQSHAIRNIRKLIIKLARSQAPVFISGESGTGKELVARLIHEMGPRAEAPFVGVNCGAVPSELMESEFFGHKKGSFTGAHADKQGFFQAANGGTLFLDEVADLPLPMQVKLLRAIQEKAVRPVGAQKESTVDVRILSATHKNLAQLVDTGDFRQDLFYRLNVIDVTLPPLRERPEDIPELIHYLIARLCEKNDTELFAISDVAVRHLMRHPFPGNVRELENILERALTLSESGTISDADIGLIDNVEPPDTGPHTLTIDEADSNPSEGAPHQQPGFQPGDEQLEDYVERLERDAIFKALDKTEGNKTAAAKLLGITFRALRYKLEKFTIK